MKKIVVLGAGISGLTAARAVTAHGHECVVVERCPTVGGLTRTVEVGDFCFDYTGHFLHLSRCGTPADIPYAGLTNEAWQQVTRRSFCFVAGKMITAPLQYNLGELPKEVLSPCVESYEARLAVASSQETTFRDYIVHGFGQYLADLFLIPQNEKTMAIGLDRLSISAVKRFFPPPDDALVRSGIRGDSESASRREYNSAFWYPKTGGIGQLVSGLAKTLNVRTSQEITAIDLQKRTLRTMMGEIYEWDMLFSSIPLKSLCQCTNDPELIEAGRSLSHSSTVSFNIGLKGAPPKVFNDAHWVYVPDRTIPFYRVGSYSNISKGTCSQGHSGIYVEVGLASEELPRMELVRDLQPKVIAALEQLGWIDSGAISCVVINVIEHAYVHHTKNRQDVVDVIRARLQRSGIYSIGRYGQWDYTSMEDSMDSARQAVAEAL